MKLNETSKLATFKSRKRVGRGIGSGKGKTSGSGHKGQKARSGVAINGFEGGQMPLHRRLPKFGFKNFTKKKFYEMNLGALQKLIDKNSIIESEVINLSLLKKLNVIKNKDNKFLKILGQGELSAKNPIECYKITKTAEDKLKKLGIDLKVNQGV